MEHLKMQFIKSLFEVIKEKGADSDDAFETCVKLVHEYTDIIVEKTKLLQEDETKAIYYLKQLVIDFMDDLYIRKAEHWLDSSQNTHQILLEWYKDSSHPENYIHRINKLTYDFTIIYPNRNLIILKTGIDKENMTGRLIDIYKI
jgi:hypothetical protein